MTQETKKCTRCGKAKPLEDFYPHATCKHGRANKCKDCTNADNMKRYRKNNPSTSAGALVCENCGKLYMPVAAIQKYCSSKCRSLAGSKRKSDERKGFSGNFGLTIDPWREVNDINMNPFPRP